MGCRSEKRAKAIGESRGRWIRQANPHQLPPPPPISESQAPAWFSEIDSMLWDLNPRGRFVNFVIFEQEIEFLLLVTLAAVSS
jgi:hypothetical protein